MKRLVLLFATGLGATLGLAGFMVSSGAGASYPGPTNFPDGSPMPANLANQPITLHVNDHGTWKVLTIHPTLKTVNGKAIEEVTSSEFNEAKLHATIDPRQGPLTIGRGAAATQPDGAP